MGWYILGLIIVLIIQGIIAAKFSSIAEEKGYDGSSYFWLCFFLSVIGYCMVAALPDLILHEKIDDLSEAIGNAVSPEQANTHIHGNNATSASLQNAPVGNWICKNCETSNSLNYGQCKKCGEFKS